MTSLRSVAKKILPNFALNIRHKFFQKRYDAKYKDRNLGEVFEEIYSNNVWGDGEDQHYSGPGSHDEKIIGPYIKCIEDFSRRYSGSGLTALDIGCGDFNVGSKLVPSFLSYTACDIVESVVEKNKEKFEGVTFLKLNAVEQAPPAADVIFIREVLQHLSNADIQKILNNIKGKFRYLIVTDSVSQEDSFIANKDIFSGPSASRCDRGSGVVIDEQPFVFSFKTKEVLCERPSSDPKVHLRTTLYQA